MHVDIIGLNKAIHTGSKMFDYHMHHIRLVKEYAQIINHRLGNPYSDERLRFIAYSHDLFKERSLNPKRNLIWNGITIPQDNNRYVRLNMKTLEEFGLTDYFNTDIQLHGLASGIFLKNKLHIDDPEILYPIFFHSCPIMPVYQTLSPTIQGMVDVIMLSDKLSSNYLCINEKHKSVRLDLDLAVFGKDGNEFNYTMGLFLARVLGQGKSREKESIATTKYYYDRLKEINPFIPKSYQVQRLGGMNKWPERKSKVLPTNWLDSKM